MNKLNLIILIILMSLYSKSKNTLWLEELDISKFRTDWAQFNANKSSNGNLLKVGGVTYEHGIGGHAYGKSLINLNRDAISFRAKVGIDDESCDGASVEFIVLGDKKVLWRSGAITKKQQAIECNVDLKGVAKLGLLISGITDIVCDHADWVDAQIVYNTFKPQSIVHPIAPPYILTPKEKETPQFNGAKIFGARPNNPFQFKVAVSGLKPMKITAQNLPNGLSINTSTGVITGTTPPKGEYEVFLTAENSKGKAISTLKIVSGDKLALTPPMGWNSWNCWGKEVTAEHIKSCADAFVSSGLIDYGWSYVNIDDGWEGEARTKDGEITSNAKFPNMKELGDYVHSKGLKFGIYTSPGPRTCGGHIASYQYEEKDAETFAKWGVDYLKYDWCSYAQIAKDNSLPELQKPYQLMGSILSKTKRDIVFSFSQSGFGNVGQWGRSVGGNLWRTTGDITDSWTDMTAIGFSQTYNSQYAEPSGWNDPDMLVVGMLGWSTKLHPSRLTANEQYTHISLWALLAAPLLLGCDVAQLDNFTKNLLTNNEVIAINQDILGKQALQVRNDKGIQIWKKPLSDGSWAVGVFNLGDSQDPSSFFVWSDEDIQKQVSVSLSELCLSGSYVVRDVWRQIDILKTDKSFEVTVPEHGVVLLKMSFTK